MKQLWYLFVKTYMRIGFTFYFKRVLTQNLNNIPKNGPILFVANHPNALVDPLLLGITSPRTLFFLTRANVFSKPLIKKILHSVNMLPIYRIRDGIDSLAKNQEIFNQCFKVFNQNKSLLIFAEGSHSLVRKVRPLSKGFTRIAFGYLDQNPDKNLTIIPLGINYSAPKQYGSQVKLIFGQGIAVKPYWQNSDRHQAVNLIKADVSQSLKNIVSHINTPDYDVLLKQFQPIDFLNPELVNQAIANPRTKESPSNTKKSSPFWYQLFKLNSFAPYLIWYKVIQPKIKEDEFLATFKFTVGITATPIFYLIQACILGAIFSKPIGLTYFISSFILAYLSVQSRPN